MNRYIGAGFYSHEWGILPFAVGLTTHERYLVFEITGVNEGFNPLHPIGKAAQAAAEYNKKVLRQLYYVKGYKQLGNIFNESGRYAEAIFSYTQALDIAPFDERAYNNRGYAYSQLGKHKEAVTDYIQALRLNPAYEKARENLEKALKKDNSAPR
jgi:tetratricopeptide (TPR) repeat protein